MYLVFVCQFGFFIFFYINFGIDEIVVVVFVNFGLGEYIFGYYFVGLVLFGVGIYEDQVVLVCCFGQDFFLVVFFKLNVFLCQFGGGNSCNQC